LFGGREEQKSQQVQIEIDRKNYERQRLNAIHRRDKAESEIRRRRAVYEFKEDRIDYRPPRHYITSPAADDDASDDAEEEDESVRSI